MHPLQCSCLKNPRDGGAWWAAISGVAQSWTRLKWLSSIYLVTAITISKIPFHYLQNIIIYLNAIDSCMPASMHQPCRTVASNSLQPHGLQHTKPPCPSPTPRACSNSCPLSQWCIQPSYPLSIPSPVFKLSKHQDLFQWVSFLYQVTRVLEIQPQHQSFQWVFKTGFL